MRHVQHDNYPAEELRFYPDFVQQYSVTKHLNASMARHGDEWLSFSGFVECLCRVTFCFLNTYGNNAQQTSPSHPGLQDGVAAKVEVRKARDGGEQWVCKESMA